MSLHSTLTNPGALVFVPDGTDLEPALSRTTHAAVAAHPDDIPVMALHGILECHRRPDRWFLGITVADGARSPRSGPFHDYTDAQMREVRRAEEEQAAAIGEYGAAVLLDFDSSAVVSGTAGAADDIAALLSAARPEVVYTHNLADRHDTHVAVALRTIEAIGRLPEEARPHALYGCEVWRGLDWLDDGDKVAFDVGGRPELARALIAVYRSQIEGGKRYDLAVEGRKLANATFGSSHQTDTAEAVIYAMDLTSLIAGASSPRELTLDSIDRFHSDVIDRIERLG